MANYWLTFTLISDATFSGGDGVAGILDREVLYDRYGLPYLRGRTLKGLLSEEADNLINHHPQIAHWLVVRDRLFGQPSGGNGRGNLHFGHAQLPEGIRKSARAALAAGRGLLPLDILESMTAERRQTAVDYDSQLPDDGSLRTMRVIQRKTMFESCLSSLAPLEADDLQLLAVATLAWRRAGTGRNRGRGKLKADLLDEDKNSILNANYESFMEGWT